MSPPYMPLYIGDYLRDTAHLTTTEHGAYLLLLFHYWTHGGIPDNDRKLAAIVKMPVEEWLYTRQALLGFFDKELRQKRADLELAKAETLNTRRKMAGAKGGKVSAKQRKLFKELGCVTSSRNSKQGYSIHSNSKNIHCRTSERTAPPQGAFEEASDRLKASPELSAALKRRKISDH
jgi:uncharacterized protein YdaU (DUF1376 family)